MILIDGKEAELPGESGVQYTLLNPYLIYDSIPGAGGEVPTFPASPTNRAIFGYWDEPQTGGGVRDYLYQHFHNGDLIREGFFVLTEASRISGYKGAYTDKLGLFFRDFQFLSLQDIDFGTFALPEPLTATIDLADDLGIAAAFPTILDADFYGTNGASISYGGRLNDYAEDAYTDSPIVPQFFAAWVLRKAGELMDFEIEGDFLEDPVWNKLLLVNLREAENGEVEIRNHLPNLTIGGLMLELRKIANLKLSINSVERRIRLDAWEPDLIAPPAADWTAKAVVGDLKTPEQNTRIQLSMGIDSADGLAKDRPAALADYLSPDVEGTRNGIAKLDFKFSTTLVDDTTGLPIVKQEGQTSQFAQSAKAWAPRLLFWNGIVDDYPRALPTQGGVTLSPAALGASVWVQTIANRARQFYLQKDFILSETDLARLDFSKKIHVEGVDYLIAQISLAVPIRAAARALLIGGV